jgi:hypothetical protein
MQFLKSKHPLVHERQLKNFDIEEWRSKSVIKDTTWKIVKK